MSKFLDKIINANSLEILKKIPDKTFDLVFADPPYNLQIGKKGATYAMVGNVHDFSEICDANVVIITDEDNYYASWLANRYNRFWRIY